MKEMMKISDRFNLVKKLGQGTFSYIYEAYDKQLERNVALKIEKKDKNKSILIFEYNVLNMLKGLSHVCCAYDFVKNSEQNLIVMDLLGNNLAKVRKCLEDNYNFKIAIQLLVKQLLFEPFLQIEMLDAIEEVHGRGFIHRDVKASNFVLSRDNKHVFIVDFGLAKKHLDDNKNPVPQRKKADFRGTVSFASLNAHNNIVNAIYSCVHYLIKQQDLSRRDDLWSLYFVILDFLNEKLKWREQKEYTMDEVKNIKTECLSNPEEKLWFVTKDIQEVKNIFYHLKGLNYKDQPNYHYIRGQLKNILNRNLDIPQSLIASVAPSPNTATIANQRVGCSSISQLILQQHNQAPFAIINQWNGSKSITIGGPTAVSNQQNNQEFQTPERPQHQRLIQYAAVNGSLINQQQPNTPITPHNNMTNNDEGAFPKASPHHLLQGGQVPSHQGVYNINFQQNFSQQLFATNIEQRKQANILQIEQQQKPVLQASLSQGALVGNQLAEKRAQLKRKNPTPIEQVIRNEEEKAGPQLQNQQNPNQYKRTKQVTKLEKKPPVKKRENKKQQQQINIIPDEEPVKIQALIDNQPHDVNPEQVQQTLTIAPGNVPIFQFSPSNANCVNQQIQISQNFFLSPQFLLLLNDQNEKALYAAQNQLLNQQMAHYPTTTTIPSSTAAATTTMIGRPSNGLTNQSAFTQASPDPQQINPQGMNPANLHNQANPYNKITPTTLQDPAIINYIPKIQKSSSSLDPILNEKLHVEDKQNQIHISQGGKKKVNQEAQFISEQFMNIQTPQQKQYHFSNNFSSMTTACRNSKRQQQQQANAGYYLYDPQKIESRNIPCFKIEKVLKKEQYNSKVKQGQNFGLARESQKQVIKQGL